MARVEVRFAGFGGQGVQLQGFILGRAVALYTGRHATQIQSYGVESRGGASRCEVVIDDKEVDYPGASNPHIFVVMSQLAYDKYIDAVRPGGVVFYDSALVKPKTPEGISQYPIAATRTAIEVLSKRIAANIVMLGAVVEATRIIDIDTIKRCVEEAVPPKFKDLNLRAFEEGRGLAREGTASQKSG